MGELVKLDAVSVNEPLRMLGEMYNELLPYFNTEIETLDALITWIAVKVCYEPLVPTPWLKVEVNDTLHKRFDASLLFNSEENHLARFYELLFGPSPRNHVIPQDFAPKPPLPSPILVKNVELGDVIVELNRRFPKQVVVYGTESDLIKYRIAILNGFFNNLYYQIVCVPDSYKDLSLRSPVWKRANRWYGK